MPKSLVLLDTWALLALINENDQWHPQATKIGLELAALKRPRIVTDWILAEFLGRAAEPPFANMPLRAYKSFGVHPLSRSCRPLAKHGSVHSRSIKRVPINRGRSLIAFPFCFAKTDAFRRFSPEITTSSKPACASCCGP